MAAARLGAIINNEIDRAGTGVFDVGAGRVEMVVVGNDLVGAANQFKQDAFAGPALMCRQDMGHAGQIADYLFKVIPAPRAGVGLVAAQHAGPLLAAHGGRAAVGEQVDQHVLGGNLEDIEVGPLQDRFALLGSRDLDRLDHLDLERLDDRFHAVLFPCVVIPSGADSRIL